MTAEAQQIAIAEACGFKITRIEYDGDGKIYRVWATPPDSWAGKDVRPWLPDINDLNACHEFEKMIGAKWPTYCEILLRIVEPEPRALEVCHYWNLLHATAAQRCEAFLKTIGKWEGENES